MPIKIKTEVNALEEKKKNWFRNSYGDLKWGKLLTVVFVPIIIVVLLLIATFASVSVGEAALLVDPVSNSVSDQPILGPSYFLRAPWISVVKIYYAVDTLGMWGNGTDKYADFPAIHGWSTEGLEIDVDVMVRWSLKPDKLVTLYKQYPNLDYKTKTVASIIRTYVRNTIRQFTVEEIISQRELVADVISNTTALALKAEPSLSDAIQYVQVDVRNFQPPADFMASIEAKQAAQQDMLRAAYERQRTIILANATAQKLILEAQGKAEAKIIQANGTKQAIQLIVEAAGGYNQTEITELYITLQALQNMAETNNQMVLFLTFNTKGVPILYPVYPTQP